MRNKAELYFQFTGDFLFCTWLNLSTKFLYHIRKKAKNKVARKNMQNIAFNNDAKENTFSHKLPAQQFRQNCCVTMQALLCKLR